MDAAAQLLEAVKNINPSDLDDLVYDATSAIASSVNNSGIQEQVSFLLESGYLPSDILSFLGIKG